MLQKSGDDTSVFEMFISQPYQGCLESRRRFRCQLMRADRLELNALEFEGRFDPPTGLGPRGLVVDVKQPGGDRDHRQQQNDQDDRRYASAAMPPTGHDPSLSPTRHLRQLGPLWFGITCGHAMAGRVRWLRIAGI